MKSAWVGATETEYQAAGAVRVLQVEVWVGQELAHHGQHVAIAVRCASLQGKPLIKHQSVRLKQLVKYAQGLRG